MRPTVSLGPFTIIASITSCSTAPRRLVRAGQKTPKSRPDTSACLRSFGIGSLTIAHANRSEQSDQKPFGSVFWFNLARAIWYVKRAEGVSDGSTEIGLYPRKFNLGAPQPPTALRFLFTETQTRITVADIADIESLASKLPLKDRITHVLRSRARTVEEIASEIPDSDTETISRTIRRYSNDQAKVRLFTKLPDARIGLVERRAS